MNVAAVRKYFASFSYRTRVLFGVMVAYLLFFMLFSWHLRNMEFFYYAIVIFLVFLFAVAYYRRLRLTNLLLVGFALHVLLHFLGGTVFFGGVRLYDVWLVHLNPWIIHYDNVVHTLGVFLLTFLAYNLLRPFFTLRKPVSLLHFSLLLFLVVMGIGACAEVVELGAVLWLDAASTVGDYFNNAFDMLFNATGSIAACLVIWRYEYRRMRRR
jgi:uncharacterized membrane protein YjdF